MSKFNYSAATKAQANLNEANTNYLNDFGYLNDVLSCGSNDLTNLKEKYNIETIISNCSQFYTDFEAKIEEIKECEKYVKE